jgi:cytoskeletal protein CcmA (bactofilin family)
MNPGDGSEDKQRRTVVEHGTEFKGTLSSTCPIDVHGRIEGEIQTPALSVSASGAVHGRAKVFLVSSEGELSGEFDAEQVELAGRVRDNTVIRARSLHVKLSADRGKLQVIFGECELSVGDEPAERVALSDEKSIEAPVLATDIAAAPAAELVAALIPSAVELPEPDDLPALTPEMEAVAAEPTEKRHRKGKNGKEQTGWSQPPSQPPPAS